MTVTTGMTCKVTYAVSLSYASPRLSAGFALPDLCLYLRRASSVNWVLESNPSLTAS